MPTVPPPDSTANFEELSLSLDEALDTVRAPGELRGVSEAGSDQRETIAPPMPGEEYVQTMMERGAIEDPFVATRSHETQLPSSGRVGSAAQATSSQRPSASLSPGSGKGASRGRRPPAVRTGGPMGFGSITSKPQAPPVVVSGASPREPSIPPPPLELDPLDDLDLFGDSSDLFGDSSKVTRVAPGRSTVPPSAGAAGLRLGRPSPPPLEPDQDDRITPIASEPAPASGIDHLREMAARFEAQDYSGALVLAESVLATDPRHPSAKRCAEDCRDQLAQKYLRRLGGPSHVPRIAMTSEEIRVLSLDHRAGFLLSSIDGVMSIEEVLDVSSMRELDALRLMFELHEQGVICIEPPRGRRGKR